MNQRWGGRNAILIWCVFGLVLVAAFYIAISGHFYSPIEPFVGGKLQPPSHAFLMGTDELGRDVLSRLIAATGVTLGLSLVSVVLAMLIGTLLGMGAGYNLVPFLTPVILFLGQISIIFPTRWLPLMIVALFGNHALGMVLSMFFSLWGQFFWLMYDESRGLQGRTFIQAAYAVGGTKWKVIIFHVFPYLAPTVLVLATLSFRTAIGVISTLSFLGIGLQPPTPTWGSMIAEAQPYFFQAWWLVVFPIVALIISVLAVNGLGNRFGKRWDVMDRVQGRTRGSEGTDATTVT
ncbi:peptide ABC transporter permease [Alicyclobacillus acidoterrestris]|uniref:ABC transporter permease n=1 Tax=Alicyclobacillus suci TaxID=2816080 RepID=UPI001191D7C9|nr:ABC transporter permease [Alicyclobacillus suci]GEO24239.1 peptide ABC transporter permease [Alicyclobacillus acidoterrestris]